MGCMDCENEIEHCHEVSVLHADGTLDCKGLVECGGEAVLHEWTVTCLELACGCVGDERDLSGWESLDMAA